MKKFYKIIADINDDNGIDFNAFVNNPAHMKGFIAFGKNQSNYTFSEQGEKRIVTGVMISADTQIFRNFGDGNESYVSFDLESIDIFRKKYFKNGFVQNVNNEHTSNTINGATLIDSYIVYNDNPNYPKPPEAFAKQKLNDGTWIASYWVTDDVVWGKVLDGTFNGFSVEGYLDKVEIKVKHKSTKMKKKEKTILDYLGFSKFNKDTFAEATTADGIVLFYEGDLVEGETAFTMDSEGEMVPAPEGEHQITLEDGSVKIITLDAQGILVSVTDFIEENADEEVAVELRKEMALALEKVSKDLLTAIDARFNKVEEKFTALSKEEKFTHKGKKTGTEETKQGFKSLLNKKK